MGIQWGFRLRFGDSVFWRSVFASVFLVWAGDSTVTTYPFIILERENNGAALPLAVATASAPSRILQRMRPHASEVQEYGFVCGVLRREGGATSLKFQEATRTCLSQSGASGS